MAKSIRSLKEAIYSKLSTDTILTGLLKVTGKLYYRDPPVEPSYPLITYSIVDDANFPYNEDRSTTITRTFVRFTIFSNSPKTEESDAIEEQIAALLHGKASELSTAKVLVYSCYRENLVEPRRDPDMHVWITQVRYLIVWAEKPGSVAVTAKASITN